MPNLGPYIEAATAVADDAYRAGEAFARPPLDRAEALALVAAAALLAVLDRLDAFAATLAGVAEDMKGATSGGLLGLLTGGRR